jgi:4-hydroxyphenylpyruvate dioxygenase-like putative hemolysin
MSDKNIKDKLPFLKDGIAQVALVVEDLDRAMEYWWKMFGVGPWHVYTYGKPLVKKMTYRGKPAEYKMRIALSQAGPTRLELIEMLEGDTIYADFVKEHGYGLQHVAVIVDDVKAAIAQAEAAGISVIQDGQGYGVDGDGHYAYLDTEDRIGAVLELIEIPKRRVPPERIYPPE